VTNLFWFNPKLSYALTRTAGKLSPFKKIKQELRAGATFSRQAERHQNAKVLDVLIANLIFSVIHKRITEAEQFTTLVSMAKANFNFLHRF